MLSLRELLLLSRTYVVRTSSAPSLRLPVAQALAVHKRSFAAGKEEGDQGHGDGAKTPVMGSVLDAEESEKEKIAQEGYKRAREAGVNVANPEGVADAASKVTDTAKDIGSGLGQFAKKVYEMGKETAGRAAETTSGIVSGIKKDEGEGKGEKLETPQTKRDEH